MRVVVTSLKWCPISEITVYSSSTGEGFEKGEALMGEVYTFGVVIEEFSESGDNIIDGVKVDSES